MVNFDFPLNPVDYLHRTGRTARAGAQGRITSLVTRRDQARCQVAHSHATLSPPGVLRIRAMRALFASIIRLSGFQRRIRVRAAIHLAPTLSWDMALMPCILHRSWRRG